MFAYCGNNPVCFKDASGHFLVAAFLVVVVTGAVVGGAMGGASAAASGRSVVEGVFEGALIGGVSNAIAFVAPPFSALWAAAAGAVIDFAFQTGEQLYETGTVSASSYDLVRTAVAAGGAALSTVGIDGLDVQNSVSDAISATIVSSDITMVYGGVDIIISAVASRSSNNQYTPPSYGGGGNNVRMTK